MEKKELADDGQEGTEGLLNSCCHEPDLSPPCSYITDSDSLSGRCGGAVEEQEVENTHWKVTWDSQTPFTGRSFAFLKNSLIASSLNYLLTHSKPFMICPVYAISAFDINHLSLLSDEFLPLSVCG